MKPQIFLNFPISDLAASIAFYEALGFVNNPSFSDETVKCMALSEDFFVMCMTRERFLSFATKPLADTKATIAGLYSIGVDSLYTIHKLVDAAVMAGGKEIGELKDYGFMQVRTVEDPDGHSWEVFFFDMSKM
ncbi:MAG: glyoxalase/bleomycin resistance/extradiol dioxygenase family protein [Saprospiraceae bacterium]|nr:glyoxalase/bleomycin resistance/extradiol dioxygenase family protein [Saprospiraceae bacterium]